MPPLFFPDGIQSAHACNACRTLMTLTCTVCAASVETCDQTALSKGLASGHGNEDGSGLPRQAWRWVQHMPPERLAQISSRQHNCEETSRSTRALQCVATAEVAEGQTARQHAPPAGRRRLPNLCRCSQAGAFHHFCQFLATQPSRQRPGRRARRVELEAGALVEMEL